MELASTRITLLDFVWDGSKDQRSVVVPAVRAGPAPSSRAFRFQVSSALLQASDAFTYETVFGSEVSVTVRGNVAEGVSELSLVCPNGGAEALALRAAVLLRLLARLPRKGGKKTDARDYKAAVASVAERLANPSLSAAELMEIYTEMRRWKLNTIE